MISAWCPNCGQDSNLKDQCAGKTVSCPNCKLLMDVPEVFDFGPPRISYEKPARSQQKAQTKTNPLPAVSFICAIGALVLVFLSIISPLLYANFFIIAALLLAFGSLGVVIFCRGVAAALAGTFAVVVTLIAILVAVAIQGHWSIISRILR